jgi:hypothetical protein
VSVSVSFRWENEKGEREKHGLAFGTYFAKKF